MAATRAAASVAASAPALTRSAASENALTRRSVRSASMTRILFSGGNVFDGTGTDPATGDVGVEGDRIVHVGAAGTGDGDEIVDLTGRTLLPGLFDCHVHVVFSGVDLL